MDPDDMAGIQICENEHLFFVLSTYFSRHDDRPDDDALTESEDNQYWGEWVVSQTDRALRRIADAVPVEESWTRRLVILVGECISDQRNGMDVMASASWDDVVEHWTKQEQAR